MGKFQQLLKFMKEVKASLLKLEERTDPRIKEKAADRDRLQAALDKLPLTVNSYIISGNGNLKNAVRVSVSFTTDLTFDDDGNVHCSDGFRSLNELGLISLDEVGKIQTKMQVVKDYISKKG